jgi:hypothetical protein
MGIIDSPQVEARSFQISIDFNHALVQKLIVFLHFIHLDGVMDQSYRSNITMFLLIYIWWYGWIS